MEENKTEKNTAEKEAAPKKDKKKSEADELRAELEALKAELEAQKKEQEDKYLRMAAEYDNFRRRSREEKSGIYDAALCDAVKELLPILDNLELAAKYDDADKVREGLAMIAKSAEAALAKLGVEKFGEVGDKFDPNLHNAVLHEENDELGEGEITDVFQKGYKKGAKIIRFAMVKSAN